MAMFQKQHDSLAFQCKPFQIGITKQKLEQTLVGTQQYSPDLVALLEENKKLKQQLKTAEMEREFLKKAAAYFAKESQ